jgi:hypothetical protein
LRIVLLSALLIVTWPHAYATEVANLYAARGPMDPQKPDDREEAFRVALNQVLVRITGSKDAATSPLLAELFPDAGRYVLQYRPAEENSLWVSLDGAAIENILRRAGQTVWSNDRPLIMVWLAVDWGQGEREIVAGDDADRNPGAARSIDRNQLLREQLQDSALQRGLPIEFPLLDAEDLEAISFSDIWGGFDDRLVEASARYGTTAVLVGRVRPAAAQPYRWTLHVGSEVHQYAVPPAEVIDQIADTLVAEFAVAGNESLETVMLTINGVDSLAAYGAVQRIMGTLNPVESFMIETVSGNRVRYVVQVYGGAERLARALGRSGKLEPGSEFSRGTDAGNGPVFDSLEFVYHP